MFNKWICPASILLEGVNNFDLHNLFLFEGEEGGGGGGALTHRSYTSFILIRNPVNVKFSIVQNNCFWVEAV